MWIHRGFGGSGFTTNVSRLPCFLGSGVDGSKKSVLSVTVLEVSTVDLVQQFAGGKGGQAPQVLLWVPPGGGAVAESAGMGPSVVPPPFGYGGRPHHHGACSIAPGPGGCCCGVGGEGWIAAGCPGKDRCCADCRPSKMRALHVLWTIRGTFKTGHPG